MNTYRVQVREVHIQGYLIKADSPEHAINLIRDGRGEMDEQHFEYSHMLDPDTWDAEINEELYGPKV